MSHKDKSQPVKAIADTRGARTRSGVFPGTRAGQHRSSGKKPSATNLSRGGGRDAQVELHRPEPETPSFVHTMLSHRSPDSATSGRWRNHEPGVRDMRSKPRLVGFQNVTANYLLIR